MSAFIVKMADLEAQQASLGDALPRAISRVLASNRFVLGEEVARFERSMAEYLGVRHAVGLSSCSDALQVALHAIGIGPSDEVITTPFSFVATAEAIVRTGARPRFVDVEAASLNLDPARVEAAISRRTRAIVVVHLFGRVAPLDDLLGVAGRHGIPLIEDAAQALGAKSAGAFAGTRGSIGCFSFFPSKVLGALGDSGLLATNDDALALRARRLREHGRDEHGSYSEIGGNFRMDAIQAAALGAKLPHLDGWLRKRHAHAERYDRAFCDVPGLESLDRGREGEWNGAVYTLRVLDGRRASLKEHLRARGVETAVYYPRPLHREPAFADARATGESLPVSEHAATEVLSLPIHAELTDDQRSVVIDAVTGFFR